MNKAPNMKSGATEQKSSSLDSCQSSKLWQLLVLTYVTLNLIHCLL